MTTSLAKEISDSLWADLREDDLFPRVQPLLAHYTSINTLEQIMGNDEIWFSNPLYMNDWEELRFGMNEGAAAFRNNVNVKNACKNDSIYGKLISHFDRLYYEFDTKHAFNTYVLCLSDHDPQDQDGVLSMWRGYGASGGGAAIVFDTGKIVANEFSPLIISKVKYGTREQRLAWIEEKISLLASIMDGHIVSDEDVYYAAYFWIERLKLFSLFTKHVGFREENEWRVVYFSERDPDALCNHMLGYAITSRGVEPKLKLKIQPLEGVIDGDLSLENIIDRIILGPTTSTVLAANSVRRILELKGKPSLAEKVVPSSIPFRS